MAEPRSDAPGNAEFRPELDIRRPERQRRWTVLLRGLLLIPQYIVLYFVGIAAGVVVFVSWFCALVIGRLPRWYADFLGGFLAYTTRVNAYTYLLVDTYPPFRWAPTDQPVSIELAPGRLNRLAVFFRIILLIPAAVVAGVVGSGWAAMAIVLWLVVLVLGRTPTPIFDATAAMLRYSFRFEAYYLMLTSAYPKRLFGDAVDRSEVPAARTSDTRPLLLSQGGRTLLIVMVVLGVLAAASGSSERALQSGQHTVTATLGGR